VLSDMLQQPGGSVTMSKREYLECVLRLLTPEQILLSASSPTPYMLPIHIKLHFVALRRLGHEVQK
jgi:hypothetical protein